MKLSTKPLKISILSILILVCIAGNVHAADDPLLKMLPGDCSFCVRINDLSGSLAKMDQYLTGVAPIGTAMLVNMQLAGIVGDPMLTGIEMSGTFAIVGLSDMTVGMLIPVTNYAEFVKNNPNCNETEGEIAVLASPGSSMGSFAMTEITGGKYALVVPQAEQGKLVDMKAALTSASGTLAAKLSEPQTKEAATAPVWAYVNLASLYNQFSPMVLAELDKAEQDISSTMGSEMEELAAFGVKLYKEIFKEFAGDADSATIALTPEVATLTADISLRAKDGSELAQMLVADPKANGDFAYTGYLDNDNAVNALMKIDQASMTKMYDKMFDILEKSNADPSIAEPIAKMKELTYKMLPAIGNEVAFSFSYTAGKPPFKFHDVVAVKDKAAMKEAMKDSLELAREFYNTIGLPIDFECQSDFLTYKNTTIDKITITFPPSDDPNDIMSTAIEQMYGGELIYLFGLSDDRYYETMGPDSEAIIKTLIDRDASVPPTGETKATIDLLQNTPYNNFVCSVNVIKLMSGLGDVMQNMPAGTNCQGEPMPDIFGGLNVPSQSSLAIGGQTANGQVGIRMVLPKQHLMEIVTAGMQIQQKMMPQMAPQPAPQPTPTPVQ